MKYELANLQDYALSNSYQYFEMIVYTAISFFIPLFLGHPQIAVGVVVNTMLITAALNLKGYKLLPVIIAPALGVFSRGMIFGPFTIYLIYMIPFIWIGNSILVLSFKYFKLKLNKNYWLTLGIGSLLKTGFLFVSALILYLLGIIPAVFLTAMGVLQLVTALAGGVAAFGVHQGKMRFSAK
ncbi:hypothetical protein ACFL0W_06005 [Nanoarchaeota archaeon]